MYDETPAPKPRADGKRTLLYSTLASLILHMSVAAWASQLAVQPKPPVALEVELLTEDPLEPLPTAPAEPSPAPAEAQVASVPTQNSAPEKASPTLKEAFASDLKSADSPLGPDEYLVPTPTPPPPEVARNLVRELPDQDLPRNASAEVLASEDSFGPGGKDPRSDGASNRTRGSHDRGVGQVAILTAPAGRSETETEAEAQTSPSGQADELQQEASNAMGGSGLGGNQLSPEKEVPGELAPVSAMGKRDAQLSPSPISGPEDSRRAPGPLRKTPPSAAKPTSPLAPGSSPADSTSEQRVAINTEPAQTQQRSEGSKTEVPKELPTAEPSRPILPTKVSPPDAAPRDDKSRPDTAPTLPDTGRDETHRSGKPEGVAQQSPKLRPIAPRPESEGNKAPGFMDGDQDRNRNARPGQKESAPLQRPTESAEAPKAPDGLLVAAVPRTGPAGPEQKAIEAQAASKRGTQTTPPQKEAKPASPQTAPPDRAVIDFTSPSSTPAPTSTPGQRPAPLTPDPPDASRPDHKPVTPESSRPEAGGTVQGAGNPNGDKGRDLMRKQVLLIGIRKGTDAMGLDPSRRGNRGDDMRGEGKRTPELTGSSDIVSGGSVASKPRELRFDQASLLDAQKSPYWVLTHEFQLRVDRELEKADYSIRQLPQEGVVTFCVQVHADGRVLEQEVWVVDGMDKEVLMTTGRSLLASALKKPLKKFPEEWALDVLIIKVELNFNVAPTPLSRRKAVQCTRPNATATMPSGASPQPARPQPLRPPLSSGNKSP